MTQSERSRNAKAFAAVSLFLIVILPFTPSSLVNFAFGVSDYPVKKFLPVLYLAKVVMISYLALFGESVVLSFENPAVIVVTVLVAAALYLVSRKVSQKTGIDDLKRNGDKL